MRIIKIGTYNRQGLPTGWTLDLNDQKENEKYCLGIDQLFDGSVDVNGIEIVEWTEKRKRLKDENLL